MAKDIPFGKSQKSRISFWSIGWNPKIGDFLFGFQFRYDGLQYTIRAYTTTSFWSEGNDDGGGVGRVVRVGVEVGDGVGV